MHTPRKLAAILAADIAGYSRLMGLDEAGTAKALREHRAAIDPILARHGGRIFKTTGDGVLVEFPSIVAAVESALAVQKLMAERNADVPEDRRMLFRIGINLGDVLIDGDDILGDGVNVAARLEGIAHNECCLSIKGGGALVIDRSKPFDPARFIGSGWRIVEEDPRALAITEIDFSKARFDSGLKEGESIIDGEEKLKRVKQLPAIRMRSRQP
jgi:Adenylate and Guanylate cyclase catalytic domain